MRRTVWFSIACLMIVALVAGGKILLPMFKLAAKAVEKYDPVDGEVGAKGDKIEVEARDDAPERMPVKTVKVVPESQPSSSDKSEPVAATDDWRPAFASVRKRVRHVRHRHRWNVNCSHR